MFSWRSFDLLKNSEKENSEQQTQENNSYGNRPESSNTKSSIFLPDPFKIDLTCKKSRELPVRHRSSVEISMFFILQLSFIDQIFDIILCLTRDLISKSGSMNSHKNSPGSSDKNPFSRSHRT